MGDELSEEWHVTTCRELESRVRNRDFFLWVSVDPGEGAPAPEEVGEDAWRALGDDVAHWLGGISADAADRDDPPKHETRIATARVEVIATPKKPNRRGTDPLVLNLYPGMTYFSGWYSAGPAPQLPDD